jgi:uncharacterized membrane protein
VKLTSPFLLDSPVAMVIAVGLGVVLIVVVGVVIFLGSHQHDAD